MTKNDSQPDPETARTRAAGRSEASAAGPGAGVRGVDGLLAEVAAFATQAIPGVDGASVALLHWLDGKLQVEASAATDDFVRDIDILQCTVTNEGPCTICMQTGRPVVSGALGSDRRWPHLGGRVARMGVHSALALPLLVGDDVIGAINIYAHDPDAFGERAVHSAAQFAGPAAAAVRNAKLLDGARERAEKLQNALGSRAVIDQAIGIIRSRSGGSADEAFARLRHISQTDNVKLSVVAQRLVDEAVRRAISRQRHP